MRRRRGPSLVHLSRLTEGRGIVEFARLDVPDPSSGYCTDDAGRLLEVVSRLPRGLEQHRLSVVALGFLEGAHDGDGFRLRQRFDGSWTDDPSSDDATGRALQGLAIGATLSPWPDVRDRSLALFDAAAHWRSHYSRAVSHAALGAVTLLESRPEHAGARRLLEHADASLPSNPISASWPWPERRLTYANALLPDALLAIAHARGDEAGTRRALDLLAWLFDQQFVAGRLSFVPVGGRAPGDPTPGFDQQPIEAWAMAEAGSRAYRMTGDPQWAARVRACAAWFDAVNDAHAPMWEPATGAGFDGLTRDGVNRNRGAESTLAALATMMCRDGVPSRTTQHGSTPPAKNPAIRVPSDLPVSVHAEGTPT